MKKVIILSMILTSSVLAWAGDVIVSSPDGNLKVTISDAGGRLYYSATLGNQEIIAPSALGLKTSIGDFTKELSITNSQLSNVSETYTMRGTKTSKGDYHATKALLDILGKDQRRFSLVFQVSDNDIAFRYEIPRQQVGHSEAKRARILSELSSFNFPEGTTTFISPQIGPESGWEQTKPSYEEGYSADAPMDTPSQFGHGYIFPALFHIQGVKETGK